AEVERAVPAKASILQRDIPGGLWFTFTGEAERSQPWVLRELVVRWNPASQSAELRARLTEGPAGGGKGLSKFLQSVKSPGGAPEAVPCDLKPWADLPSRKPGQTLLWQDDVTRWNAIHDPSGLAVVLRDFALD